MGGQKQDLARVALGRYGEERAVAHLVSLGMRILERNWRCGIGELDVVALDGDDLVVCEVKTRAGTAFGGPFEAVTPTKLVRLRTLAGEWLRLHPCHVRSIRVDVVGVACPRRGPCVIEHRRGV